MKKILFFVLACCSAYAVETSVWQEFEGIARSTNKAWKAKELVESKNSVDGYLKGKKIKDVWSYWYIKAGDNPQNFELLPMKYSAKDSAAWGNPYWAANINDGKPVLPATIGVYGYATAIMCGKGMGFAFTNPFNYSISMELEGNLAVPSDDAQFFVFTRSNDDVIKILKSSSEENAIYKIETKKKDKAGNVKYRKYFRLGLCFTLAPKNKVYIVGSLPKTIIGPKHKGGFRIIYCLNEGQGAQFTPKFIITGIKNEKI
ncbi:MAG: hypothetical protein WCS73_07410 [Lentisphaeria bacterium]